MRRVIANVINYCFSWNLFLSEIPGVTMKSMKLYFACHSKESKSDKSWSSCYAIFALGKMRGRRTHFSTYGQTPQWILNGLLGPKGKFWVNTTHRESRDDQDGLRIHNENKSLGPDESNHNVVFLSALQKWDTKLKWLSRSRKKLNLGHFMTPRFCMADISAGKTLVPLW